VFPLQKKMPALRRSPAARLPEAPGPGNRIFAAGAVIQASCAPMLEITPDWTIPDEELVERFVRSSGPGGQNVNKVATAVELRFDVRGSPSVPEPYRERVLARRDRRLTAEGVLVISAQRFRTQDRNREDARERLAGILREATVVAKKRIATKPSKGAKERRLTGKKERSTVKKQRTARWDHE
jgi:ribosome-associated protein